VIIGIFIIDLLRIYSLLIIVRAVLSWVRVNPRNELVRILYALTDPILVPIQNVVPPIGGGLDISPIIALVFIWFLERLVAMIFF
jgi:YggT family protein